MSAIENWILEVVFKWSDYHKVIENKQHSSNWNLFFRVYNK